VTRVIVVDEHDVLAATVATVLSDDPTITVAATMRSLCEVRDACWPQAPDVVLVGQRLADSSGVDACAALRRHSPSSRTVALLSFPREQPALAAFAAGAAGVVVKEVRPAVLRQAVHAVAAGGMFIDPLVAGRIVGLALKTQRRRGPFGLTLAELRVLERLPTGLTNREIGVDLGVAESTVKTHVTAILRKLDVADRASAAARARREGLT
jgi:two-component system response regulator DevR